MQSKFPGVSASGRLRPTTAKRLLRPLARLLQTGDPGATVDRLFVSQHVDDLRLIVAVSLLAVLLAMTVGIPLLVENVVVNNWKEVSTHRSIWTFVRLGFSAASSFVAFFGPVLVVFGALLVWAYQTGSARLGVVDLFACEISTLCRVAAVVDTVHIYVKMFDQGPPAEPADAGAAPARAPSFTSQEDYFPVFASNTRDLQTLEARVGHQYHRVLYLYEGGSRFASGTRGDQAAGGGSGAALR